MARDLRVWPVLVAAGLLLTGCATIAAPPAGLTGEELEASRKAIADGLWAETGLYPDQRPATPSLTVVSVEDWPFAYVKCMNNAGFDNYTAESGGYTWTGDRSSELERLTNYVCAMSFQADSSYDGGYNIAEIDYLYEYYAQSLVPCLAANGHQVESVPTHGEFEAQMGTWHPYFAMHTDKWLALFDDRSILVKCPPNPKGMKDPGYAAYFDD